MCVIRYCCLSQIRACQALKAGHAHPSHARKNANTVTQSPWNTHTGHCLQLADPIPGTWPYPHVGKVVAQVQAHQQASSSPQAVPRQHQPPATVPYMEARSVSDIRGPDTSLIQHKTAQPKRRSPGQGRRAAVRVMQAHSGKHNAFRRRRRRRRRLVSSRHIFVMDSCCTCSKGSCRLQAQPHILGFGLMLDSEASGSHLVSGRGLQP